MGGSDFTLGFRLAGIRKIFNAHEGKNKEDVAALLRDATVGVVIMDQPTFDGLSEPLKEDVTSSIKPVFVILSEKPQEGLRKMIIRAIGVDLLREEG